VEAWQVEYYNEMRRRDRAALIIKDGHLVSIVTYFVGDDDNKYLHGHTPWTVLDDDPEGTTLYIDQWLTMKGKSTASYVHREFTKGLKELKKTFKNIKRAKWIRVDAQFRKHGIKKGVKQNVHCKNLKF
jgi:hypothetical protein